MLDMCVAEWLHDIRFLDEMENTQVLLSKPIAPLEDLSCLERESTQLASPMHSTPNSTCSRQRRQSEDAIYGCLSDSATPRVQSPVYCEPSSVVVNASTSKQAMKKVNNAIYAEPRKLSHKHKPYSNDSGFHDTTPKICGETSSIDSACGSSATPSTHSPVYAPCSSSIERLPAPPPAPVSDSVVPPDYASCMDVVQTLLQRSAEIMHLASEYEEKKNYSVTEETKSLCITYIRSIDFLIPFTFKREDQKNLVYLMEYCRRSNIDPAIRRQFAQEFYAELRSVFAQSLSCVVRLILSALRGYSGRCSPAVIDAGLCHLAQCALIGDWLCSEIVQAGGVRTLLSLCKSNRCTEHHTKQALRVIAALCSISTACSELLAVGGLELIVDLLLSADGMAASEAAGVIAQLTAPCHPFTVMITRMPELIKRLLDLLTAATTFDAFLLTSAAVANLSLQHGDAVCEALYQHNAVRKIGAIFDEGRVGTTLFEREQLVTILGRLCAHGYESLVTSQDGVRLLLSMLLQPHDQDAALALRIRNKAAVALAKIAESSYGMKMIYTNAGAMSIRQAFESCRYSNEEAAPLYHICRNLLDKITTQFSQVTLV